MFAIGRFLLWGLSLGVAGYAVIVYLTFPPGAWVHPDIRPALQAHPEVVLAHVLAAALALALGPLQFLQRLRRSAPSAHRWVGRGYCAGVLVGGIAGLYMAFHAYGGAVARAGFASLALAWLYTGLRAYLSIRARDVPAHRSWMIRNFALTFAAVTLRLYVPAAFALGIPLATAYPAIAWLCWVPNLLAAQQLIAARKSRVSSPAPGWRAPARRPTAPGGGELGACIAAAPDRAGPGVRGTSSNAATTPHEDRPRG